MNRHIAAALAALAFTAPLAAEEAPAPAAAAAAGEWRTFATEAYRGKRDSVSFVDDSHGWYGTGAAISSPRPMAAPRGRRSRAARAPSCARSALSTG